MSISDAYVNADGPRGAYVGAAEAVKAREMRRAVVLVMSLMLTTCGRNLGNLWWFSIALLIRVDCCVMLFSQLSLGLRWIGFYI